MRFALLLSLPLALAAPAFQLVDASLSSLSRLGSSGQARTMTSWLFVDCGASTADEASLTWAGQPSDVIEITGLEVSPDPPEPGKPLVINASGTVKETIDVRLVQRALTELDQQEGSYADVVVKLGLIKILTKRFDICEELRNGNATLQCPVKPGDYDITQTVDLPEEIPKGVF